MHLASRNCAVALALAASALLIAACAAPATTGTGTGPVTPAVPAGTTPATSAITPTTTPVAAPAVSAGPITTPGTGTALRAAVLDAAMTGLGLSGKVTVIQLYAQDSAAVGDIQPATGPRLFFAVTGGPDSWSLAWSTPFGSSLANATALRSSAPLVSEELAAKVNWTKKVAKPAKAPTLASFAAFAMKSAKNLAGASYTGTFTVTAKIAKDGSGVWWGNALAVPSVDGLESIGVFGRYSNGKWTGEIADFSQDNAEAAYFPGDVLSQLTLP